MNQEQIELPQKGGIVLIVELELDIYVWLLRAANEVEVPVAKYAEGLIANYVEVA